MSQHCVNRRHPQRGQAIIRAVLANNGGPTQTHALLPGSPAIDVGSSDCPPPATDQRGVSRPQDADGFAGADCDIGAFELEAAKTRVPNHAPTLFAKRVPVAIAEPDSNANAHAFTDSLAWPKPDAHDINDADSAASAKGAAFTDADAGIADAGLPGARRRQPPRPRRQRHP